MEAAQRNRGVKRLAVHQRVSCACGEWIPGPTKRRRRQRLFGQIVRAVDGKKYLVRFDNGHEQECHSNSLKVEGIHEALPPDVIPPAPSTTREQDESEEHLATAADQEEEEDLPAPTEADDEAPVASEEEAADDPPAVAPESTESHPTGMPGQLPSGDALPKDYSAAKKAAQEKIAALVGHEVTVTSRTMGTIKWKVVASVDPEDPIPEFNPKIKYGLKGFDVSMFRKSEVFSLMFLRLLFKDWKKR